jgi:NAD-dependent SIR2 family protein deacetylase
VELHGALADVRCLACGEREGRDELQQRLLQLNPGWTSGGAEVAPDGDAVVDSAAIASFTVASCLHCGGELKPDVVFFGENVPGDVVDRAWSMLDRAEALLVVGSSLAVYSGFRFVKRAAGRRMPIAIVNRGPTRGDEYAWAKLDGWAGEVLPALAGALCQGDGQ